MFNYLIRRLLLMLPTLIGVTAVVFFVMALSPGGIGASLLSTEGALRPEERKAMEAYYKARYGLDRPLPVQYAHWLNHVSPIGLKTAGEGFPSSWKVGFKYPDLGESYSSHRPVSQMIGEAVPITILLELLSLPLIYIIAIWTGIRSARSRGKVLDVGMGFVLLAMFSMPEIWIGMLFIGFLTNHMSYVHWFPSNGLHDVQSDSMLFLPSWSGGFQRGWLLDMAWHLCLPVICLSYGSFAFLSRLQRGALLEALNQDFVRTARAKGLSERVVIYRHAFRNSLMPLITVAARILPALISGAIVIETIFGVPGMGKLAIDSVFSRDRELLMGITLIASLLQLIGYLIGDVAYAVADPRVSYVD
ncbi:MAG TPA: ABC transporter permease [Tepidisphaeraceae bacterium]|nr:ABC transporter permease [Tepidisphaeraceae bacterium]